MPNGPVHKVITCGAAVASLPLALTEPWALSVTAGVLTELVVDPDLDMDGWTAAENRLRDWWRPAGDAWFYFWLPYAKIAKHRGLSHAPILGTLGRAAYLLAPALIVMLLLKIAPPWLLLGGWFLGLAVADLLHIAADVIWTAIKRAWRRWLKGRSR